MKCQVDEMLNRWNIKLMKHQVDEMQSRQNTPAPFSVLELNWKIVGKKAWKGEA